MRAARLVWRSELDLSAHFHYPVGRNLEEIGRAGRFGLQDKQFSRQRAMPGRSVEISVSRDRKNEVSIGSNSSPAARTGQNLRHIGHFFKAVARHHLPEAVGQADDLTRFSV